MPIMVEFNYEQKISIIFDKFIEFYVVDEYRYVSGFRNEIDALIFDVGLSLSIPTRKQPFTDDSSVNLKSPP